MKRILLCVVAVLALVATAMAAAPTIKTIDGLPLKINVGSDASFQIFNANVPGSGQIYPSSCQETADMGVFVDIGGTLYAPNFLEHGCATATSGLSDRTPWTPVTISEVTGSGSPADPYKVVVVCEASGQGIRLTLTVSYINGRNYFAVQKDFSANAERTFNCFFGGDIYLASSDYGIPYYDDVSRSPGGKDCNSAGYVILFIPINVADAYTARHYSEVWREIGAGTLSNTVNQNGCEDNGAALQWNSVTVSALTSKRITSAVSFGDIPDIARFRLDEVQPPLGGAGETLTVKLIGIGFQPDTTFDFGPGITVTNLNLISSFEAEVTVEIDPAATLGIRSVTGTQSPGGIVSTLLDAFEVTRASFAFFNIWPTSALQGQIISLEAVGESFRPETTFDFGPDTLVMGTSILSEQRAVLALQIGSNAQVGLRNVTAIQTPKGRKRTLELSFEIKPGIFSGADLTGTMLATHSCKVPAKCQVRATATVKNTGNQPAPKSKLRFYSSITPVYHPASSKLIATRTLALKPGQERSITIKKKTPSLAGQFLIAVLDADGQIAEYNEANNYMVFGPIQ